MEIPSRTGERDGYGGGVKKVSRALGGRNKRLVMAPADDRLTETDKVYHRSETPGNGNRFNS